MKISFDEMVRYILILREENMENYYNLSDDQKNLIKKVENNIRVNSELKNKLTQMMNASSMSEMLEIYNGRKLEVPNIEFSKQENVTEVELVKENIVEFNSETKEIKQEENGRQLTLTRINKKAGYVDALVMALVTGFVGGASTMIMFMMIK